MIVMMHFFETVVRYDRFFQFEPQHIPDVLVGPFISMMYLDELTSSQCIVKEHPPDTIEFITQTVEL